MLQLLFVLLCPLAVHLLPGLQGDARNPPAQAARAALTAGRTETREIAAGALHEWEVTAAPDDYVVVTVESLDVDVSITLVTPAGQEQRRFNHSGYAGTQIVRWVADTSSGAWTIRIAPIGQGASGRYRVTLSTPRRATDRDRTIVQADSLVEEAAAHQAGGRGADAERLLEQALDIATRASGPDSSDVSSILHKLADIRHTAGEYGEAVALLERALRIDERAYGRDSRETAIALNNLGYMYDLHGRYREAEPLLNRALEIRLNVLGPENPRTGVTLDNLAVLNISLGRFANAEQLAARALQIFERNLGSNHYYVSYPLNILASVAQLQGQYEKADGLLRRALQIDGEALGPTHANYAAVLSRLGRNAVRLGRHAEARDLYERALEINRKANGANHPTVADGLWNLARLDRLGGDLTRARTRLDQVLSIERATRGPHHPMLATTLLEMARLHLARTPPEPGPALELVNQAIAILDKAGGNVETRASAYAMRAQLYRQEQKPREAMADLAETIRLVEDLRPLVGGGEETRASFFEPYTEHFDRMTAWQAEAGDFERAFEYAERGLARVLLDQLAATQFDIRNSLAPDIRAALESREGAARTRMAELRYRIAVLRSANDAAGLPAAESDLRAAEREYVEIHARMKNESPLWRDHFTSGGRFVTLAAVQRELLSHGGLMLMYQIGAAGSRLLMIPAEGAPQLLTLRVDARAASLMNVPQGDLTVGSLGRMLSGPDGGGILARISTPSAPRGVSASAGPTTAQLHALWQVLVPEAARRAVLDAAEVVIVPDSQLHDLPFEALVTSTGEAGTRYWIDDGPVIRYAPSATVLYNLTRRPVSRLVPRAGTPGVLSVSDPIYDVGQAAGPVRPAPAQLPTAQAVTRNSYERLGGSLARLPGTLKETDAIRRAYGSEAARAVHALQGLEADESGVRRALPGKRYVHLATHALVGGSGGALFASLVLTPPAADTAQPESDGFLQLHEIYELRLPDIDLAVLSACETNRGPNFDGEGVFALSRGFLAAGARRVVASQWPVDDASTAMLMGALFAQIVDAERAGRTIDFARALRDAKASVRKRPEWSAPYHWAPFVLTGPR